MPAEEVGGRGQRVGGAGNNVAAAPALGVGAEFQIGGRHELGLADLARPRAPLRGSHEAVLDEHERVDQFGPIDLGAAAIIGERRESAEGGIAAGTGAEIVSRPQIATRTGPGTP